MTRRLTAIASPYMDANELAEALDCSRASIYRWRAEKRDLPPAIRIGGNVRWRRETVAKWLADQEAKAS